MKAVHLGQTRSLALFSVVFALCFASCRCGPDRPKFIFRLDHEAKGWMIVVFNRPHAPALPMTGDDAFVVNIPKSGVLVTSTKSQVGTAVDEYWMRRPDGPDLRVPWSRIRAEQGGWDRRGDGKPMEYDIFFVGSEEELKAAEADDGALVKRVYESEFGVAK